MAYWDDDDDDESLDDVDDVDDVSDSEPFSLPDNWDDWLEFDWDSYDGEYEEFAVSADY